MKKITILSLDGGGIRGIISCIILRYLEELLRQKDHPGAKLGDYFDMIAGSSTGGILASVLLCPDENGKAKYSIKKAFELYTEKGEDIFNISLWERLINPFGLFSEKISQDNLETQLRDFFGDLELKNFIKPSLITSYDIENRRAKLFTTTNAQQSQQNFFVRDICRATSAAPTYFSPVQIRSSYGQIFSLIDVGVFANNPSLCAYAEARKIPFAEVFQNPEKPDYPSVNDMMIVSLGTGTEMKSYPFSRYKNVGKLAWVNPIIDILLSRNYLKEKFETNDTPREEDFSDWMDSYWHKDDKIPMENLTVDVSSKADRTAENLSAENITSWKAKLNEPSQITIDTTAAMDTNMSVNGMRMHGKNVVIKNGSANITFQCLSSSEPDFMCTVTKAGTGNITFAGGSGVSIVQTDYTAVLNGAIGSTAKLQRIGNVYYLRIFNA